MLKGVLSWLKSESQIDEHGATQLIGGASTGREVAIDTNIQARLKPLDALGKGGMCVVHNALDVHLLRHSALKVMHEKVAAIPDMHHRFVVEARITAQLDHPNIIPIYEFGQDAAGNS